MAAAISTYSTSSYSVDNVTLSGHETDAAVRDQYIDPTSWDFHRFDLQSLDEYSFDEEAQERRTPVDSHIDLPRIKNRAGEADGPANVHSIADAVEEQVPASQTSENEGEAPVNAELHGIKLWMVMAGITLTAFLMLLDTAIVATGVPSIVEDLGQPQNVGWYGAAYQLASAALLPLTGKLYTNFSLKWTFIGCFAVFELGSLICGVAQSSNMLIVGRAIAGIGGSGISNGNFTIIAACAPIERRPALLGICQGIAQFGLVLGPLIGGLFSEYASWRWDFYINLPLGVVVAAFLFFVTIPEQIPKSKALLVFKDLHNRVDIRGFLIFAPSIVLILIALQWGGNTYSWDSANVVGLLVGGGVLALIWLSWDWYMKDDAMIPLSIIKRRTVWAGCLTYSMLFSTMINSHYYLPTYFQAAKGASPTMSGVYMLPTIVSQLVGAIVAGRLVSKVGYYLPFSLFSAVFMAVGCGLLSTLTPDTSAGQWIGYQIIAGTGFGTGIQMPLVAVQNALPPPLIPVAMALVVFSATFGGAIILSASAALLNNSLRSLLSQLSDANIEAVIESGGLDVGETVSATDLPIVLSAYATSINRIYYMLTALSVVAFCIAWAMGMKSIRKKETVETIKSEKTAIEGRQSQGSEA